MAKKPATGAGSGSTARSPARWPMGPKLIGFGVALFVVTRIVKWLPLGLVGSWINGILWPVLLLSIAAGAGLVWLRSKRSN